MVDRSLSIDLSHGLFCLVLELLCLFWAQSRNRSLKPFLQVPDLARVSRVGFLELHILVICPHRDRRKLLVGRLQS